MKYYIKNDGRMVLRTQKSGGKKGFVVVDENILEKEKKLALTLEAKRIYARLQREIRRAKNPRQKKVNFADFWDALKIASDAEKMEDIEQTKNYYSRQYKYSKKPCRDLSGYNKKEKSWKEQVMSEAIGL